MSVKITYRKGYPTKKCIQALLAHFNIHGIRAMDSYDFTHSIAWGGDFLNAKMLNFVDSISTLGIKVSEFREANSPTTGSITFAKK